MKLLRRKGWMALSIVLVLWWATGAARVGAQDAATPEEGTDGDALIVEFVEGLLTVKAVNRPTATVLRRIARRTGVKIVVFGEPERSISIDFESLRPDDGLRRILGQYNLVLLYREVDDPVTRSRKARLTEAQVIVGAGANVPTMEFAAGRIVERVALARRADAASRKKNRDRRMDGAGKNKLRPRATSDAERAQELERLKTAAFDADPNVRADAVDDLGLVEDERAALDILERVLREDSNAEVRANAISNLEDLEQVPVEPVLDAVLFDEAPEVRIGAMEIIGEQEWKDRRTVDTLSRVLEDPNEDIRLAALEVLGELEERRVLEVAARSNPHEEIRELAAELLAALKQ